MIIIKIMMLFAVLFYLTCTATAAPYSKKKPRDITIPVVCGETGDCLSQTLGCAEICGCDRLYYYNKTDNSCVLDQEYLKFKMIEQFDTQEWIREESERVFKGIIISAIIFLSCAGMCGITACLYCCYINYSDQKLRKDVKALAIRLDRDGESYKTKKPKKRLPAVAESCNVTVEDAGIFVC